MNLVYSNLYKHASFQAKISPNGNYIANAIDKRLVIRQHSKDLTVMTVHEYSKPIDYIEWAPNSEYILSCNYEAGRIDVRSIKDTNWHGIIRDNRIAMVRVMWTVDSKHVLYTTDLKLLLGIWNLSTLELKYINHIKYTEKGIETSPDGNYIAIARKQSGKDYISIYQSDSFVILEHIEVGTVDLQGLKWSPDSMFIAVWDHCIYHKLLVYRQDGELCMNYSGYDFDLGIKTVTWSPNGELIAIGNYNQTIHLISTRDWTLTSVLNHQTTIKSSMNIKIMEEILSLSIDKEKDNYNIATRRPYQLNTQRVNYNEPNPKLGIGLCQFSMDSSYIYSRNDNTPNILWMWQVKSLECHNIIVFKQPIRQALWNPLEAHMLVTICGNEKIHFLQPTDDDELEIVTACVPIDNFSVKRTKWNSNGNSLLLMDSELFCLAVL